MGGGVLTEATPQEGVAHECRCNAAEQIYVPRRFKHRSHAPVVDLCERQVGGSADVVLLALVRVRAVDVLLAPVGHECLGVVGQQLLGLRRPVRLRLDLGGQRQLLGIGLVAALAVSLPPLRAPCWLRPQVTGAVLLPALLAKRGGGDVGGLVRLRRQGLRPALTVAKRGGELGGDVVLRLP